MKGLRKLTFILISKKKFTLYLIALLIGVASLSSLLLVGLPVVKGTSPLKNYKILLDAGHGGQDPGAVHRGLLEKQINLEVALKTAQALEKAGAKVILTRDSDIDFYPKYLRGIHKKRSDLNHRIEMGEEEQAHFLLSLHVNKDYHASCYGAEVFYHPTSKVGKALAMSLQEEFKLLQPRNRRIAKAADYYLLKNSTMPAVIIEMGFISNPEEKALLQKGSYQDKIAQTIVKGLERHITNSKPE